jgi:uncharacterized protein (UPF0248 family)
MMPIHELLNRIRWDREFGRGEFALGYLDRVTGEIIQVPFREVAFPKDNARSFQVVDVEGSVHRVPFHRVREVDKDGHRIWQRPARG